MSETMNVGSFLCDGESDLRGKIQPTVMLEASHLGKTYRGSSIPAVENVSFVLHQGEVLSLVGESGSGKSTIAKMLCGILAPDSGLIRIAGRDLSEFDTKGRARYIQMVYQDPYSSLNPRRTIRGILTELLTYHKIVPPRYVRDECSNLMRRVGMDEDALDAYPSQFSGGQRQRLAIARSICIRPRILIADEAVSALDVSIQKTILELLLTLSQEMSLSLFFISHNLAVVQLISDTIMVMHHGHVVESGKANDVLSHPNDAYTRELIRAVPRLHLSTEEQ